MSDFLRQLREPFSSLLRLKNSPSLLPVYAGVIAEARKSMDDWIPLRAFDAFVEVAGRYGLVVVDDCIFEPLPVDRSIDALDRAPTTRAAGLPMSQRQRASPEAAVHVFVSRRRAWAEEALCSFSYPVAIPQQRLLVRPRIDATRIGAAFGYPKCCVDAFMRENDWHRSSHFSTAYSAGGTHDWRVNCLPRATPFMSLFHVPCRPTCGPSVTMSASILEAVGEFDESYAQAIGQHLRGTFLIIHEALVWKLHDAQDDGRGAVRFRAAESLVPRKGSEAPRVDAISQIVERAEWISLDSGSVSTRCGDEEDGFEVDPKAAWLEDPCLVRFVDER